MKPARFCLFLLLLAVIGGARASAQSDPALSLSVSQAVEGEEVVVTVLLDANAASPSFAGVFLQYDTQRLDYVDGSIQTAVFDNELLTSVPTESETGIVSFSAGSTAPIGSNDTPVAQLRFRATNPGNALVQFLTVPPRGTELLDENFATLPVDLNNTSISIVAAPRAAFRLEPANDRPTAGETIDVDVVLDAAGTDAAFADVTIEYDATRLTFTGGALNFGTVLSSPVSSPPSETSTGAIRFYATLSGAAPEVATLATLQFETINAGLAEIVFAGIAPEATHAYDADFLPVPSRAGSTVVGIEETASAHLSFSPGTAPVAVGDILELQVELTSWESEAKTIEAFVGFDAAGLDFLGGSINSSEFSNLAPTTPPVLSSATTVSFIAVAQGTVQNETVHVATLQFLVMEQGTHEFSFRETTAQQTQVYGPSLIPMDSLKGGSHIVATTVPGPLVSVEPILTEVEPNDVFAVTVQLEKAEEIRGVNSVIAFDPAQVEFISGSLDAATFPGSAFDSAPSETSAGRIGFAGQSPAPLAGTAALATLEFRALVPGIAGIRPLAAETTVTDAELAASGFGVRPGWAQVASDAPFVQTVRRPAGVEAQTNANEVLVDVAFSEPVTGVDETDFSLQETGTLAPTIVEVTGSDDLYTLRIDTAAGEGTLAVTVGDDDSIVDAQSSPLGGPGADNGVFASGVLHIVDRTAPTVALATALGDITNSSERIVLTFSEAMPALTPAMLTLTNLHVTDIVAVGNNSFNIGVQPQAQGACTFAIDAGAITDLAGNALANGATKSFTFDSIPPEVAFVGTPSEIARFNFAFIDLAFTESPTGFTESDLVSNGTISQLTVNSTTGRFRVSAPATGDRLEITIAADSFTDRAGNTNPDAVTVTIDVVPQFFTNNWRVF